jgi:1,4-alpha-glucan branching enzyme
MKNKILLFTLFLLFLNNFINGQVTCSPIFPGPDDNITITYNANEGSRGLATETGDIYAHTGVITDKSSSSSDWKYVKFPWTTNNPSVKLTSRGNGIYTLSINNIRQFYGVPMTDKILKLSFVFRNSNGSKEGKTATNGDIFYDIVSNTDILLIRLVSPASSLLSVSNGGTINVQAAASLNSSLTLTDNGTTIASATNAKDLSHTITVNSGGVHFVQFKAVSGTKADSASFTYFQPPTVETQALPSGLELGANINAKGDSVTFVLQAPNKQFVFITGSFNNYQIEDKYVMKKSPDGKYWWLKLGGFTAGQNYTYQYLVDGNMAIADPLSTLILDPSNDQNIDDVTFPKTIPYPTGKANGHVSVLQPGKTPYIWKVNNFVRPNKRNLIIYELLIRDFVAKHNYLTLIDSLPYLKRLGINAIELMPVNEFENNESWGYNPSYHNALDKYYGTPDHFKQFVDKCHENGIAVIADVVFNHAFGQSPLARMYFDGGKPAANNPWLNVDATHPFNVGYDMNHESEYTKNYVERCLKYWLTEYRIDGFRFDLSKGFTQTNNPSNVEAWGKYDAKRIDILKNYHQVVQKTSPGAYSIMEHFAENSEETELADNGMMVWANANYNFNEATMGYTDNKLSGAAARERGWSDAKHDNHIPYMESHDEERLMFKNISYGNSAGNYSIKDLNTGLKRIELASAFFYLIPGPRMLWQFGELGYEVSIDFNGRVGNKPIRWEYFQVPERKRLYDITRNIISLRQAHPVFQSLNYTASDLKAGYLKAYHIQDNDMSVTVLGNFNVVAEDIVPAFQKTGDWYSYLTGDLTNVTDVNKPIRLLPGEYRIYTSKKMPVPPAGFARFSTSLKEFSEQVNTFEVYPNPTTSNTTYIGFNLKNNGMVQWEAFNLLGQKVAGTTPQYKTAGSHQEALNQKLPSGQYLIKLTVNGYSASKKLIVE